MSALEEKQKMDMIRHNAIIIQIYPFELIFNTMQTVFSNNSGRIRVYMRIGKYTCRLRADTWVRPYRIDVPEYIFPVECAHGYKIKTAC